MSKDYLLTLQQCLKTIDSLRDERDKMEMAYHILRERLCELLEVHSYIDNSDEHQTKATQAALDAAARLVCPPAQPGRERKFYPPLDPTFPPP